jgi:putative tryptophan/tyrosine transport system substrate-binding protein
VFVLNKLTNEVRVKKAAFLSVGVVPVLLAVAIRGEAQQAGKVPRIGYLTFGSPSSSAPRREAFREGLRKLNYIEGQNIIVEYRYADSKADLLAEHITELIQLKVDIIVAGGTQANVEVKKATSTIPIVIANSDDPLGSGLVESLARPGGNATGLSSMSQELSGKRLELFKEAFPKVRRLAVLWHSASDAGFKETRTAAQDLGLVVRSLEIKRQEDLDNAFATVTKEHLDALFAVTSSFMTSNRKRIVEFAGKHKLPAIYSNAEYVEDGGLMSYATNSLDLHRRAATYVDRILKGAKPGELPVEQPTKFELVINLKTAKQSGVTIPPKVLARADRVIK